MAGDPTYWRRRPRAPLPGSKLGRLEEIPNYGGKEYVFGLGKSAFSMFVIRRDQQVWGYLNICPHYSLPLNYRKEEFVNEDGSLIRCSMHFAEFRVEDGQCVAGAAEGCTLEPVPVIIKGDELFIQSDE